jgi:hypothetical protein
MVHSTPQISLAPVINFHGTPGSPDLQNIAGTLVGMLKEQVETMNMRIA